MLCHIISCSFKYYIILHYIMSYYIIIYYLTLNMLNLLYFIILHTIQALEGKEHYMRNECTLVQVVGLLNPVDCLCQTMNTLKA